MINIILVSLLISLIFAPLGCISLWKKYNHFGDSFAHASLLSGGVSAIFNVPVIYSGLFIALIFSFLIYILKNTSDSNIVIDLISSFMLASSFMISFIFPSQVNFNNLLFGDIIMSSLKDVFVLTLVFLIIAILALKYYREIILIILSDDIAKIQSINVRAVEFLFLVILSVSVFLTINMVGVLLIGSILTIPPATARLISNSPIQMIVITATISLFVNFFSIILSIYLDTPIMPISVIINAIIFFALHILKRKI